MAKVQKSLRIDSDTYEHIQEIRREHESESEVLNRVLRTGVDAIKANRTQEQTENNAHLIEFLEHSNELLEKQLVIKDEQISALTSLCDTAQKVSGLTTATTSKALDTTATSTATSKPSFKERMRNFFS